MNTRALFSTIFPFVLLIIAASFAFNTYSQELTLVDNIEAYFPFNDNANDLSGNENHGTVNGASLTTDRFGNPNSAYNFDGTDDYIEVLGLPTNYSEYSFTAWVKHSDLGSGGGIVMQSGNKIENNSYIGSFGIGKMYGRHRIYSTTSSGLRFRSDTLRDLNWHFYVHSWDGNHIRLYRDGQLLDSLDISTTSPCPFMDDVIIGAMRYGWSPNGVIDIFYNGKIDDVRIYSRAITSSEVFELYQEGCDINLTLPDTVMACHQDSLILDAGAGFETYLWSTGDTTQTLSVFQTGTYAVTVEDSFGCMATDSTYVNIINAHIAQNDTTISAGVSIELSMA